MSLRPRPAATVKSGCEPGVGMGIRVGPLPGRDLGPGDADEPVRPDDAAEDPHLFRVEYLPPVGGNDHREFRAGWRLGGEVLPRVVGDRAGIGSFGIGVLDHPPGHRVGRPALGGQVNGPNER